VCQGVRGVKGTYSKISYQIGIIHFKGREREKATAIFAMSFLYLLHWGGGGRKRDIKTWRQYRFFARNQMKKEKRGRGSTRIHRLILIKDLQKGKREKRGCQN